jgi:hypothetical protein
MIGKAIHTFTLFTVKPVGRSTIGLGTSVSAEEGCREEFKALFTLEIIF